MKQPKRENFLVVINKINVSRPRQKYAWLVVERNEGVRLITQLNKMCQYNDKIDIIVVDGNSSDGTKEVLLGGDTGIREMIVSKAKAGFSTDLQIGLLYAAQQGYSGVITSDGNGKDSVDDVLEFIEMLDAGVDLIQGSRFLEAGNHANTPLMRYLGIRFISSPFTSLFARIKITDSTNGFRGYSKKLIENDKLKLNKRYFDGYSLVSYLPFFVGKNGMHFCELSVRRDYPASGATPTKIVLPSQWFQIVLDLFRAQYETYVEYENSDWLVFLEN